MAGKYKTKQQAAIRECLELNKDSYVTVSEIEKYLKNNNYSVGLTTIPPFRENGTGWNCGTN